MKKSIEDHEKALAMLRDDVKYYRVILTETEDKLTNLTVAWNKLFRQIELSKAKGLKSFDDERFEG